MSEGVSLISVLVVGKPDYEYCVHLGLAARAFGASSITFVMHKNSRLVRYFSRISARWGGNFVVDFKSDWKQVLAERKNYKSVYLTMFGVPIQSITPILRTYKNLLVIISTEEGKNLIKRVDFNVGISTQPHVSVSALSVFLHEFYSGRELAMHFENAKYKVVPMQRDIKVKRL